MLQDYHFLHLRIHLEGGACGLSEAVLFVQLVVLYDRIPAALPKQVQVAPDRADIVPLCHCTRSGGTKQLRLMPDCRVTGASVVSRHQVMRSIYAQCTHPGLLLLTLA